MKHIIRYALDLELEQGKTNPQTPDSYLESPKIIQIGVVFFNSLTKDVLGRYKWYINIGVPLSSFIKKLTGITDDDLRHGCSIQEAYDMLLRLIVEHNANRRPVVWGSGDLLALQTEVGQTRLGRGESNVKALWQDLAPLIGKNGAGGLGKSLSKNGIQFKGRAHDALVDAENTMIMFLCLMDKFVRNNETNT